MGGERTRQRRVAETIMLALALAVAVAPAGATGCAGGAANAGGSPDAGAESDAGGPPGCEMTVAFAPPAPEAGMSVVATATIIDNGASGIESYSWQVLSPSGAAVTTNPRDASGSQIDFFADSPGPYQVRLDGTSDGVSCDEAVQTVNVAAPGANTTPYRLRATPPASSPAVAQELAVAIPGGADYDLGTLTLQSGTRVAGVVSGPGGAPLPAYLRLDTSRSSVPIEAFSGQDGAFAVALPPLAAPYSLLVVPDGVAVAPVQFSGLANSDLAAVVVPAGVAVTGQVVDSSGAPVAGARVLLTVAGVPSTLGTTDAAGAFSVRARAGAAAVSVVPPAGAGLPRLELAAAAAIAVADGTALSIAYAQTAARTFSPAAVEADGTTPAAGARVTFETAAPIANAGTVTPAGGAAVQATGSVRETVVADAAGKLPSLTLPETSYEVVAEPGAAAAAGQGIALSTVDLSAGAPATLALAAPAELTATVVAGGKAVAGARVAAQPLGALAEIATAGATAVTASDGSAELALAGGGDYQLVVTPPVGIRAAPARVAATAPAAGAQAALGQVTLAAAIKVTGRIAIAGGGTPSGFSIELLCGDGSACSGVAATQPIADAATGNDGGFVLMVPDPGATAAVAGLRR